MKSERYQIGRFAGKYYVIDTRTMRFVYGPFTRRSTAVSRLRLIEKRKSRTNPVSKRKNPASYREMQSRRIHRGDVVREKESKVRGIVRDVNYDRGYALVKWEDGDYTRISIKHLRKSAYPLDPRRLPNPRAVTIYGRVLRIEAQKTQPHQCDPKCKAAGHRYFHDFKGSSNATLYGMPDHSLKIVGRG